MQARGYLSRVVVDFETTYGQDPVTKEGKLLPFNTCELSMEQAMIKAATITGTRNPKAPGLGNKKVSGTLVVPVDLKTFGIPLKACFGAPVTAGLNVAGKLYGGYGVTEVIGTWNAVTTGRFKIVIDSSAATEVGPIDFSSGATTMALVAGKIQTAIRAIATGGFSLATVAWDAVNKGFVITSGTTGAASNVGALTNPATGVDISGAGFMRCTAATLQTITPGEALYSHTFKVGSTQPSMVVEKRYSDGSGFIKYAKVNGAKCGSMKMDFGGDGELVASFDILAASESITANEYDATPTDLGFSRLNNFEGTLLENSAVLGNVTQGNFSMNFGLSDKNYVMGSLGCLGSLPEGIIETSGSLTTLFDSTALLDKAMASTETSITVKFARVNQSLSFIFDELKFSPKSPGIAGPEGLMLELPWDAYYEDGANQSVATVVLINNVASYA